MTVSLLLLSFLSLLCLLLLLPQVQHVFDESPFLVPDNSVSIMNGSKEGNVCPPFSPLQVTDPWRILSADPLVLFSPLLGFLGAQTREAVFTSLM